MVHTEPANEGGADAALRGPGIGFARVVGGIGIALAGAAIGDFTLRGGAEEFELGFTERIEEDLSKGEEFVGTGGGGHG